MFIACRRSSQLDSFVLLTLLTVVCLFVFLSGTAHSATVDLTWDANAEPDLAGYRVYYGTASRNYSETVDLGRATTCSISGLAATTTYYFAVTAYDTEGLESGFSNEVSYTVPADVAQLTEEDFVTRFYRLCLNREPDAAGSSFWVSALTEDTQTAADVAKGFVLSQEFANRNTSNEQYVDILYTLLFDRSPDSDESEFWIANLQNGLSRSAVLDGLVYTREFADSCAVYGITPFWEEDAVQAFVARFYRFCLGREPDPNGLNYWATSLLNGSQTGAGLAYGFVFSQEFLDMHTTNEQYLNTLYNAFFSRVPDQTGFQYWLNQLNAGVSRQNVLDGFTHAQEFSDLCAEYGVKPY